MNKKIIQERIKLERKIHLKGRIPFIYWYR